MRAPAEMKWGAVNVILHWLLYVLIIVMFVTGVMLYLGRGGWWVVVHSTAAFAGLGYIFGPCRGALHVWRLEAAPARVQAGALGHHASSAAKAFAHGVRFAVWSQLPQLQRRIGPPAIP